LTKACCLIHGRVKCTRTPVTAECTYCVVGAAIITIAVSKYLVGICGVCVCEVGKAKANENSNNMATRLQSKLDLCYINYHPVCNHQ
jgi:hypothetical protein